MTREDIIKLAREAGLMDYSDKPESAYTQLVIDDLKRFAALVATAEREKIAKEWDECSDSDFDDIDIGATIRARGEAK